MVTVVLEHLRRIQAQCLSRDTTRLSSRHPTKGELEDRLRLISQTARGAIRDLGADPDEEWVGPVHQRTELREMFPDVLYVNQEKDTSSGAFLLCNESGVSHLDNGTLLGVYRRDGFAAVKVTVEVVKEGVA
jgi:hypothetical protein